MAMVGGALALGILLCAASAATAARSQFCVLSVEETGGDLAILHTDGHLAAKVRLGERPHEVAVTPDGRTAFVSLFGITDYASRLGTPGTRIARIDLTRGRLVGWIDTPSDSRAPHGVRLRPPAFTELFVNTEAGSPAFLVFDVRSGALLRRFAAPKGAHNFVFSSDGRDLFAFAGAQGVYKVDVASGRVVAHADLGSPVRGLRMGRDGSVLAAANGEVVALAPADLGVRRRMKAASPGQLLYLDQWPDGVIIAPSMSNDGVQIFSVEGRAERFVKTGRTPIQVARGPDGLAYVGNVNDDHITVLDPRGDQVRRIGSLNGPNGLGFGACPVGQ
jgi:DNA-binding beta-propeller fold protein YncE